MNSTGILPPLRIRGLDTANCATAEADADATTDADAAADIDSDAEAAADGLAVADAATGADVEGDGAPGLGDVAALQPASRTHASPTARSRAIDRSVTRLMLAPRTTSRNRPLLSPLRAVLRACE